MKRWIILWLTFCVTLGAYFLLRSNPAATSIPFLPRWLARWCDHYPDLRTFVLVFGMSIVPALGLMRNASWRWRVETALLTFFLAAEVLQLWIPRRVFSWWDMLFSVSGVAFAEAVAAVGNRVFEKRGDLKLSAKDV